MKRLILLVSPAFRAGLFDVLGRGVRGYEPAPSRTVGSRITACRGRIARRRQYGGNLRPDDLVRLQLRDPRYLGSARRSTSFQHIRQSATRRSASIFDFYIHVENDDDRGKPNITDRQRNEIKTDAKSPESMVARQGEELVLRWKFRLPEGMQTTKNFCHVHQIKGIDNSEAWPTWPIPSLPLRPVRSNGKQELQVIYVGPTSAATGNVYLARVPLSDFLGEWVEVEGACRMRSERKLPGCRTADLRWQGS